MKEVGSGHIEVNNESPSINNDGSGHIEVNN